MKLMEFFTYDQDGAKEDNTYQPENDISILDKDDTRKTRLTLKDINSMRLASEEQAGMKRFINSGKGFVCLHISGCLPDHWSEYHDITGGGWISGTSFHPPYGHFTVNVSNSNFYISNIFIFKTLYQFFNFSFHCLILTRITDIQKEALVSRSLQIHKWKTTHFP